MRELKLRYFIDLASNIGAKSRTEAQAVEQSQRAMQSAVDKTSMSVRGLDSAYMRFSANSATERQIGYMRRLGQGIDQVRNKMHGLAQLSADAMKNVPGAVAGVAGGFYAAKAMLDKPIDYDTRLRGVTNTAYAGQDIEALRKGKDEINDRVMAAVRQAKGSKRDDALIAYEKLVGSGSFEREESDALLPKIMRTSVAFGADANDLAQASEKMKMTFGLSPDQIGVGLAKLGRGGQEGGFEIKDSAKWVGQLAPYFKGYKGMAGVEAMVTMLQQVRSTAGTNDEAANNLRNFVQKIGSDSTRKDFKKQGIDLDAEMAKGVVNGETPVDTYMRQLEKVMAKQDPEGKARAAMKVADKTLSPEERQQRYEAIAEIYKSSGISKIINDLQEMGGYSGLAGTKEYGKNVLAAVKSETGGAVEVGYQFRSEGTGAIAQDAANESDNAQYNAFASKSGVLNLLLSKSADLAREFPEVAKGAALAAGALTLLAASAGIFALLARRNVGGPVPRGGPGGGLPRVPGSPGAFPKLDGAKPSAAAGGGWKAGGVRALGLAGNLAYLGYELFGTSEEDLKTLAFADAKKAGISTRGKGYNDDRLLAATMPSIAEQAAALGPPQKLELGKGELAVNVRVTDERTTASATVTTPMSGVKVSAGATNPEGTW